MASKKRPAGTNAGNNDSPVQNRQAQAGDLSQEGVAGAGFQGDLQLRRSRPRKNIHPLLLIPSGAHRQPVLPRLQVQKDQNPSGLGQGPHRQPVQGAQQSRPLQGPAGVAVPHPAHGAGVKGNHRPAPPGFCWVSMDTSVTRVKRRSRRESISTPVSSTTKDSL